MPPGVPPPTEAAFSSYILCTVGIVGVVCLFLNVVEKLRSILARPDLSKSPVTREEFESKLANLQTELKGEINRPNPNYVTQAQLDNRLERLENTISLKIDEGGQYLHRMEHEKNNQLHSLNIKVAEIAVALRMGPKIVLPENPPLEKL